MHITQGGRRHGLSIMLLLLLSYTCNIKEGLEFNKIVDSHPRRIRDVEILIMIPKGKGSNQVACSVL